MGHLHIVLQYYFVGSNQPGETDHSIFSGAVVFKIILLSTCDQDVEIFRMSGLVTEQVVRDMERFPASLVSTHGASEGDIDWLISD